MSDPLETLLLELRQQGKHDSQGVFTLDSARARRQLSQFQLADPYAYAAHLVASAVASGARRIDVNLRLGSFRIESDGRQLSRLELESLAASLFADAPALVHLKELGIALYAAAGLHPELMTVTSTGPQGGCELSYTASGESLVTVPAQPNPYTVVEIRQRGGWKKLLQRSGARPEVAAIEDLCRYCPVPLRINGNRFMARVNPGRVTGWRKRIGTRYLLPTDEPLADLHFEQTWEEEFSLLLVFPGKSESAGLTFVINGLRYPYPAWPGWAAVGWLPRDLSGGGLVESDALASLLAKIELEWWALLLDLTRAELTEPDRERLLEAVVKEASKLLSATQAAARQLVSMPLVPCWDGSLASLEQVEFEARRQGFVWVSKRATPWTHPPLAGQLILRDAPYLATRYKTKGGDHLLHEAAESHRRGEKWRRQPKRELKLPSPNLAFELADCRALAYLDEPTVARVRFLKEGRPLGSLESEELPPDLLLEVENDHFLPLPDWSSVSPDCPILRAFRRQLPAHLGQVYADLAEPEQLVAFLVWAHRHQQPAGAAAAKPVFETVEGGRVSLEQLRHWSQPLPVGSRVYAYLDPEDPDAVVYDPALEQLFEAIVWRDRELAERDRFREQRNWWLEKYEPAQPGLPPQDYPWTGQFEGGMVAARSPAEPSRAYCWREGRPLGEVPLETHELPWGFDVLLVDDQFPPDRYWARVVDGPRLDAAVAAAARRAEDFYRQGRPTAEQVLAYFHYRRAAGLGPCPEHPTWSQPILEGRSMAELMESDQVEYEPDIHGPHLDLLRDWLGPDRLVRKASEGEQEQAVSWLRTGQDRPELPPRNYLVKQKLEQGELGLTWPHEFAHLRHFNEQRLVRDHSWPTDVPFEAYWVGEEPPEEATLEGWARELAAGLLEDPTGARRSYLLELVRKRPFEGLAEAPLFVDWKGHRYSYNQLEGVDAAYLAGEQVDEVRELLELRPEPLILVLDYTARIALEGWARLTELGSRLEQIARRREPASPIPPRAGWVRLAFDHGELALSASQEGVNLIRGPWSMGYYDPYPGLGLTGWFEADFEPNLEWNAPAHPQQVKELMTPWVASLIQRVVERFPPPTAPDFGRARQAIFGWSEQAPDQLTAAMKALPMVPWRGGGWARLSDLLEADSFAFAPPGVKVDSQRVLEIASTSLREAVGRLVELVPVEHLGEPLLASLGARLRQLAPERFTSLSLVHISEAVLGVERRPGELLLNQSLPAVDHLRRDARHWEMLVPFLLQLMGRSPRQALEEARRSFSMERENH
ncbi:MAG: hypothetical protein KC910_04635 [Candidatus Eremiobacteraeota bacterium]|nr:hypothetical protein [Candidatus Eremiobacteraeota bacterium]